MCCWRNAFLRWMDAISYRQLGRLQSCNGFYSIIIMVFWKNVLPDIRYHVVPVDVSEVAGRPVIEFGVEIFVTDKFVEFDIGNSDSDNGVAFLGDLSV